MPRKKKIQKNNNKNILLIAGISLILLVLVLLQQPFTFERCKNPNFLGEIIFTDEGYYAQGSCSGGWTSNSYDRIKANIPFQPYAGQTDSNLFASYIVNKYSGITGSVIMEDPNCILGYTCASSPSVGGKPEYRFEAGTRAFIVDANNNNHPFTNTKDLQTLLNECKPDNTDCNTLYSYYISKINLKEGELGYRIFLSTLFSQEFTSNSYICEYNFRIKYADGVVKDIINNGTLIHGSVCLFEEGDKDYVSYDFSGAKLRVYPKSDIIIDVDIPEIQDPTIIIDNDIVDNNDMTDNNDNIIIDDIEYITNPNTNEGIIIRTPQPTRNIFTIVWGWILTILGIGA